VVVKELYIHIIMTIRIYTYLLTRRYIYYKMNNKQIIILKFLAKMNKKVLFDWIFLEIDIYKYLN
jgi:hypothetical protein